MFYQIDIPNIVHNDISEFWEYIYRVSFSKEASKKVINDLYKAIFSLEFLPNRFQKYFWDYRRLIVWNSYKIIYRIDEENKNVVIIRIFRSEKRELFEF